MHDLIIIGAGIAGMTASIYASRYGIKHLIFGADPGGQGNKAHLVENYPGVPAIKGPKLMEKIVKQVESYGVEIKKEKVVSLETLRSPTKNFVAADRPAPSGAGLITSSKIFVDFPRLNSFVVKTEKEEYKTKSLILAMGASYRHLNIPGEDNFLGRGVSYCAVCDAPFFKDKIVAVAGGGDSAVSGAIHVSNFAKKVYLIHRRNEFRAEKAWVEKLKKNKNIEVILSSVIKEVYGKEKVEGIVVATEVGHENFCVPLLARDKTQGVHNVIGAVSEANSKNFIASPSQPGKEKRLKINGLFIEIGQAPSSILVKGLGVKLDKGDYVLVDSDMATNVSGVFAAGDLAAQKGGILFRQFVTAAADGARAASSVYHYLTQQPAAPSWGKQ